MSVEFLPILVKLGLAIDLHSNLEYTYMESSDFGKKVQYAYGDEHTPIGSIHTHTVNSIYDTIG
jgi:hypothetical protein